MIRLKGFAEVARDKSISHRGIILGSLAKGRTIIKNFLYSEDCLATISCLTELGVNIESNEHITTVDGVGPDGFIKPSIPLDAKNSGTTTRLLTGILCGCPFESVITGDVSLQSRPMKRIIEPLTMMGAKIEANNGTCPMRITGGRLRGIEYNIPIASAQLKSALILAGLYAEGETVLYEKIKTRDHTERMLKAMGANIEIDGNRIIVGKTEQLKALTVNVPCDISSAAFFIVAASIIPDSDIIIKSVGINKTRTGIIDALREMGADIRIENEKTVCNEEIGDLHVKYSDLKGVEIGGDIIPRLIDELPIIAVAAAAATGKTVIRDASELRVKESDRIKSIAEMLTAAGVKTEELDDGLIIYGGSKIKGALYDSHIDHRIAMSAKILSLLTDEPSRIKNFDCVNISFPDFAKTLEELMQ